MLFRSQGYLFSYINEKSQTADVPIENRMRCRELLQRILGMHIVKLKVVLNQKAIQNNIFQKGTRLDIYAEDDKGNMYDIEMQLTKTRELVPRSRYYHCEMDGHQIATGETYEELKQSIVIFLCEFDLFHKDQSVYTFEMRCNEDPTICLDEKRKTIFVNLHGKDRKSVV